MGTFGINITQSELEGIYELAVAGENIQKGQLCYLSNDQKYYLSNANDISTCSTELRIALEDISVNTFGNFLISGKINVFNTITTGSLVYLSDTINGNVEDNILNISDNNYIRKIGTAYTNSILEFNPDETFIKKGTKEINNIDLKIPNTTYNTLADDLKSTIPLLSTDTEINIVEGVAFNIPRLTTDKTLTFINEVENKMIKLIVNLNGHSLTLPTNVNTEGLDLDGGDVWEVIEMECTNINGTLSYIAKNNAIKELPIGGTAGQVLSKASNGDFDVEWRAIVFNPSGTNGQIQFNNNGEFGADNELYWDNVNKRLGIGTTTPEASLEIYKQHETYDKFFKFGSEAMYFEFKEGSSHGGAPIIAGYSLTNAYSTFLIGDGANDTGVNPMFRISGRISNGTVVNRPLFDIANVNDVKFSISANGNVGIGTTEPTEKLHVNGKTRITDKLYLGTQTNDYLYMYSDTDFRININGYTSLRITGTTVYSETFAPIYYTDTLGKSNSSWNSLFVKDIIVSGTINNTVRSILENEPVGSEQVLNMVSLTQAEYDAGIPEAGTIYNITDA